MEIKKKIRFIMGFLLCSFLLSPLCVKAMETDSTIAGPGKYHAVYADEDTQGFDFYDSCREDDFTGFIRNRKSRSLADTSDTGLFGTQLSGIALDLYNGLSSAELGPKQNGISLIHILEEDETAQGVFDTYRAVYSAALYAYGRDRHDLFLWWSNNKVGIKAIAGSSQITLTFYYSVSDYYTEELQAAAGDQIDDLVKACTGYNRETKLRYYHDWIVSNSEYDTPVSRIEEEEDPEAFYYAHTAVGCLLMGKGVCESYSKLLKIFCIRENIPCLMVTSNTHAWNYVKMEDGNWYMVDVTWDDQTAGIEVDDSYFLVSNEPNIDSSHTVDQRFTYPSTSPDAFQIDHDYRMTWRTEGNCIAEGSETYTCSHCGDSKTYVLPVDPLNHTGEVILRNRKDALNGEDGYTGDLCCRDCGAILEAGENIPAVHKASEAAYEIKATPPKPESTLYLSKVAIVSLKNISPRSMKVRWKRNKKASGYQLQYALDGKFRKGRKTLRVRKSGTITKTIRKLKKGRKYYVRIRAYKIHKNNTFYSAWSISRKVRIRK